MLNRPARNIPFTLPPRHSFLGATRGILASLLLLAAVVPGVVAQGAEGAVYRVVAEPETVVVAVGEAVPLEVRSFDLDGNPVELELRLSAPRTGLHVRGGEVLGREVGEYNIHVSIVTPDGPRSVPASIYVDNPPPGMPRGPQPVMEIPVTVVWPPVERVEVMPISTLPGGDAAPVLFAGTQVRHRAEAFHADGSPRRAVAASWGSSDPEIATVDRYGTVSALQPGTVSITAEVEGVSQSVGYTVEPFPGRQLELTGGIETARTGEVVSYRARVLDGSGQEVGGVPLEWSYVHQPHDSVMARGAAAEVKEGRFVAEVPGVYSVLALAGPLSARATVEVHPRQVLHRVHQLGRGPVRHTMSHDFWVFAGVDGRDYAITGSSGGTAYVWDVTDPADIQKTDSITVDARQVNDVKVSPDARYAVLTREGASDRRNGVVILDLSNPRNPTIAAEFTEQLTGGVHNAWPENDYLYALSGGQRYMIIDMGDLQSPRIVGSYGHPGSSIHDVIVHDGIAYSSEWEFGVVAVDVGNGAWGGSPQNPVLISETRFPEMLTHTIWPYYQESTGRFYLFASDEVWPRVGAPLEGYADLLPFDPETGEGGRPAHTGGYVHILDYTDPTNPQKVARYQMDEYGTHNPWVEDDILYQGYYEGGLRVMDVSGELQGDLRAQGREMVAFKPYDPQGFIANAPMVWGAQPHKGVVFFSDANSGLWAVRIEPREGAPVF
ncbi:MAG: Ig-like domain-containing protein [Gemmatimonadota bacterium]